GACGKREKGRVKSTGEGDHDAGWAEMKNAPSILEGFVNFRMEISVIVARSANGETAAYVPVENRHKNHILDITLAPADISAPLAERAMEIAEKIAVKLDLVGLLAVEMFVTEDNQVLVNELAPRPH